MDNRPNLELLMKDKIAETSWDVLVVGGGATGVGVAIDAASRGYKTLLVEKYDFGSGTSSKSTKLIHGGVRYLQQGNISLVHEALKERAILKRNAPHIVHDLKFVVPIYEWWEGPFYGTGLKLYDLLAGREGLGSSEFLSKEETISYLPTIEQESLRGGVLYYDAQFDDTRLLISMMRTAEIQGATLLNYHELVSLSKNNGKINGAHIRDVLGEKDFYIKAKVVINATGVFADKVRLLDNLSKSKKISGSQGVHIVLDASFLPGESSVMIPATEDGRVLFAVPWYGKLLLGTTDTPVETYDVNPKATEEEIDFLLSHAAAYLTKSPTRADVKSIFSGLRPLVKEGDEEETSKISREHQIEITDSGLVSIMGGKWTTYRKMAKDTVNKASTLVGLPRVKSKTDILQLHGYHQQSHVFGNLSHYGSDALTILKLQEEDNTLGASLLEGYPITRAHVVFAVRFEKAKTVEDVLARRTRLLFLDVAGSIAISEDVAQLIATELNHPRSWVLSQVLSFKKLASAYQV